MTFSTRLLFCCLSLLLFEGSCSAVVVVGLAGDFNLDGIIDSDDLSVWESEFGDTGGFADANLDGMTDIDDLYVWKANEGLSIASPTAAPPAATPEAIYNQLTGALSIRANGNPIYAFKFSFFGPDVLSVTNAGLPGPGAWDVRNLFSSTSVQGFDSSILGDPYPVTSDYSLDQLGVATAKIAELSPGLDESAFESLSFGHTDGSGSLPTLLIVPEPCACWMALLAAGAVCGILRSPKHSA